MQETELKIKIKVDDTESDKALAKAKELQNIHSPSEITMSNLLQLLYPNRKQDI